MNYANVGLGVATGTNGVSRQHQRVNVGWTAPTTIYEKQRQIQASAASLDADIAANVKRQTFKGAWNQWYANWKAFFAKYQDSSWNKLGAVTYTDALDAQTEGYRNQLLAWYDAYGAERDGDKPLPPPSAPAPAAPPPKPGSEPSEPWNPFPKAPEIGLSVPWYVWAGLGVVAAGSLYYLYTRYVAAKGDAAMVRSYAQEAAMARMMPMRDPQPQPQWAPITVGHLPAAYRDPSCSCPR
jgi:hypothetical protein